MVYKTQVDKNHYIYGDYLHFDRWISYFHQLNNVFFISKKVKKPHKNIDILEIGVGDKIVSNTLKNYGYAVKTMDISAELQPDIVAALPDIPIKKRVDCILC